MFLPIYTGNGGGVHSSPPMFGGDSASAPPERVDHQHEGTWRVWLPAARSQPPPPECCVGGGPQKGADTASLRQSKPPHPRHDAVLTGRQILHGTCHGLDLHHPVPKIRRVAVHPGPVQQGPPLARGHESSERHETASKQHGGGRPASRTPSAPIKAGSPSCLSKTDVSSDFPQ